MVVIVLTTMSYYLVLLPLCDSVATVKRHQCLFGKRYKKHGKCYEYPGLLTLVSHEMLLSGVYRLQSLPDLSLLQQQDTLRFLILSDAPATS